ncbi:nuclear transport factor 2 family protein [Dyadobacter psychrotolerans]|uniref:Nuclear transport factor 2 family protein n=1 Tax=Dyadobacter psychrotolerans TaxID=2541721 RepID=A0A4R5DS54_9BACT|nr:nuclear transport factor 2 family protein [Dyadobacter psychrotolerans]TDE13935.1 nuclear transport factor 2 family protein [Dyadobacter psychrotolerans]
MKKIIFLTFLVFSGVVVQAQSTAQPIDATDCSNLFFKALLEENGKALDNLLATDFSITSFDGKPINRGLLIQVVAEGYLTIESGMLSGAMTKNLGDVSVITGTWSARGQVQNNGFNNDVAYMTVCVKSGGNWKVSAVQLTPIR